jgi:hypothetical protein
MKKNLIYYLYLENPYFIDKTTLIHLNCLKFFKNIFDGEKIIYVTSNNKIENEDEIKGLFDFFNTTNITFKVNDSEKRESFYFLEQMSKIESESSITFFAHNKGVTNNGEPDSLLNWILSMYFFNLSGLYISEINDSLNDKYNFYGVLRKTVSCPPWVYSNWHYSGTYFWFNTKKIKTSDLSFFNEGRFEVESFPGNHSSVEFSKCDGRFSYDYNFDARISSFWDEFFTKLTHNEINEFYEFKKNVLTNELTKITNYLGSDKGDYVDEKHSYTEIYESIFILKKNTKVDILEIGIKDPRFPYASVKIWDLYFKNPKIFGLDINDSSELEGLVPNFKYYYLDQYSVESHNNLVDYFTNQGVCFDIIIDDGPHFFEGQGKSLRFFQKLLKQNSYYIIEDIHVDDRIINHINSLGIEYSLYCNNKLLIITNR